MLTVFRFIIFAVTGQVVTNDLGAIRMQKIVERIYIICWKKSAFETLAIKTNGFKRSIYEIHATIG
ncbi:hypothetical protein BK636_17000 [Pseudomonas chlororaphis]|nr:hypothetical protein BK636_17000 [Pseudomonas chlororaphis]